MNRRIKVKSSQAKRVRSVSKEPRRIDVATLASALGAEAVSNGPLGSPAWMPLAELRRRLVTGLKSSGGRPGLEGTERRQKIPMSDEDWARLGEIADSLATNAVTPTAGQVASQLLHDAIQGLERASGSRAPRHDPSHRVAEPRVPYLRSHSPAAHEEFDPKYVFAGRTLTRRQQQQSETITRAARAFAEALLEHAPASSDRNAALRSIREAAMLACAAVSLDGRLA